jgi:hypothetical protein
MLPENIALAVGTLRDILYQGHSITSGLAAMFQNLYYFLFCFLPK